MTPLARAAALLLFFAAPVLAQTPATQPAAPKPIELDTVPGPLLAGAFSKDSKLLVVGGKNSLYVITDNARTVRQIGLPADVLTLALSPDKTYIAAGLADKTIALVTVAEGVIWRTIDCRDLVLDVPAVAGFLPDSRTVVGGGKSVGFWSVGDAQLQRSFPLPVQQNRMALSPDGKILATGWTAGGGITLLDAASGKNLPRQPETKRETATGGPQNPRGVDILRFTADGRHVYAGGFLSGGLFFYNTSTGTQEGALLFDHFARGSLTDDLAAIAWGTWDTPGPATAPAGALGLPPQPTPAQLQKPLVNTISLTLTASHKNIFQTQVSSGATLVLLSPNGHTLVASTADGKTLLWQLAP
jgi:WD40 repeat protein